ncbi:MAG: M48 family metalloprotease [Planctomycetota bacterium]
MTRPPPADALSNTPLNQPSIWFGFAVFTAGIMLAWLWQIVVVRLATQAMDTRGSVRSAVASQRALAVSALLLGLAHTIAVFVGRWVDHIRNLMGDWILIDELVVILPALIGIAGVWWIQFAVERRLRDAAVFGALAGIEGRRINVVSAPRFVMSRAQQLFAFLMLPIGLVWSVREGTVFFGTPDWTELVIVLGMVVVLPVIMVRVAGTVPITKGELRDAIARVGLKQGARINDIRVWRREDGAMNAALVGTVPGLRAVLVTETLLEGLGEMELEAVVAHEVGHARRRHIPWMLGWIAGIVLCSSALDALAIRLGAPQEMQWAILIVSALIGIWGFGMVSRRCEWQADAFAAQHLSGMERGKARGGQIEFEAAGAMRRALGAVAAHAGMHRQRFDFRHGSIAERQRRLDALIGLDMQALPIDQTVRNWQIVIIGIVLIGFIGMFLITIAGGMP